ncbi:MAG: hypothetical protein QM791_09280 [Ferruginibacter sp.]
MKKFFFNSNLVLFIYTYICLGTVKAQTITVVPNPTAPDIFAWVTPAGNVGAVAGYTGVLAVYNNSLVLGYNTSGTSDLNQIKQQLAVYKTGDSLHLIPNPDAGQGVYFQTLQIAFDNKLFFIYNDAAGVQRLASFNGTSITLYPNPDASTVGFIGSPRILNNTLYVAYVNAAGVTQFGRFTGTGITLIPNPDNGNVGFFNNYSVVFNNKLVGRYVTTSAGPKRLASFDGTQWTILPNPDNTPDRGVQPVFPTLYKNKLYFVYLSVTGQRQLMEYDGSSNPKLIANPQNSGVNAGGATITDGFSLVYNDTMFYQYYDINNVYRLAKFDGTTVSLVPNPDATTYGYWWKPVIYNNGLYILYQTADAKRHLAQYKSSTGGIQVFPNPDAGGYSELPIVLGDKLYIRYFNAQNITQLASFDGSTIQLIPNPSGIYNSSAGNNGYLGQPIIFNDKLYMQFGSVPYGNAGNLAYLTVTNNNGICPGSNTSFTSNVSGSSYQWQVDNGSGTYTNLSNAAPYSTVTTATLTLTAPATSLYGYKYRCVVNGNTNSAVFTLKFASNWTGATSTAWETISNWSCGAVPDANTDVYITPGKPNAPAVNSTRSVRSIHLQNGATMAVSTNQKLTLTGK